MEGPNEIGVPPFLSVITRHMKTRPKMLAMNTRSLRVQSDPDFEQLILIDDVGRGCKWAQQAIVDIAPKASGKYILVLDDDEFMANPDGIALLKMGCESNPRGAAFQSVYYGFGPLPTDLTNWPTRMWGMGAVGQSCYILRRDVFQRSSYVYRRGFDETDFLCLLDAWETARLDGKLHELVSVHHIINAAQRSDSRGKPE